MHSSHIVSDALSLFFKNLNYEFTNLQTKFLLPRLRKFTNVYPEEKIVQTSVLSIQYKLSTLQLFEGNTMFFKLMEII